MSPTIAVRTEAEPQGGIDETPGLAAVIGISGGWEGSLALTAPELLVRECVGRLFGRRPDEVSEVEVQDAWGELANSGAPRLGLGLEQNPYLPRQIFLGEGLG